MKFPRLSSRFWITGAVLATAAALILLITMTRDRDLVKLSARNFAYIAQPLQNLVFSFNKDLAQKSEIGTWQKTQYIQFNPPIEGSFKWLSSRELVFSPAKPLKPCQNYSAVLQENLIKTAKQMNKKNRRWKLKQEKIEFHTPWLAVENVIPQWTRAQDGSAVLALQVNYNYDVDATEVARNLEVKTESSNREFKVSGPDQGKSFRLEVIEGAIPKKPLNLLLTVKPGMKVSGSAYQSPKPLNWQQLVPDPSKMEVVQLITDSDDEGNGKVRILLNQSVEAANLASHIKIEPEVNFSVQATEEGILLSGKFDNNTNYSLSISESLTGVLGGKLSEAYKGDLFFGELPPAISFVHQKGMFLTNKGFKNIAVNIRNLDKVHLEISKIYANNILPYLHNNRYGGYGYWDGEDYVESDDYNYSDDYNQIYSDKLIDRDVEVKDMPDAGIGRLLHLDNFEKQEYKGVFLVKVSSQDEYYLNATKLVSISDLGLIARRSDNQVMVLCNSIQTSEPQEGVEIALVSKNNQEIARMKTDASGLAMFNNIKEKMNGFELAMVTATTSDDYNFMFLEDNKLDPSRFETGGHRANSSGQEAFIYGDRNLYRPGETVHLNVIIRKENWANPGAMPVKIKVTNPMGQEWQNYLLQTNEQGAVPLEIPLENAGLTGQYRVSVYTGNDIMLNDYEFQVEEFLPDRIKVNIAYSKPFYQTGDKVILNGEALNMFGPPAANRNYETDFAFEPMPFQPPKFKDYTFYMAKQPKLQREFRQGTTGEDGKFSQSWDIPADMEDYGIIEGTNFTTVFDDNGRPVNRVRKYNIYTQKTFYGIKSSEYFTGVNQPFKIPMVALDKDFKPVNSNALVEIYRIEWQNVLERNDYEYRYRSHRKEKLVYSANTSFTAGQTSVTYVPTVSGDYEVRVSRPGAKNYSIFSFYAYTWGITSNSSFGVNTDGDISIETDKTHYETGEKVKVLLKTPFDGRLLVTLERNKVFEHHFIDTKDKTAGFEFTAGGDHLPNVYLTATLIKKLNDASIPLTVAHGVQSIAVEKKSSRLTVSIEAPDQIRSSRKQKIRVKTSGGSGTQVTLAVVDEGILQIRNYESPDAHKFFFAKRALQVEAFDIYKRIFPELSMSNSLPGGDAKSLDMNKRVNPLANNRVKLVALWSGILKTSGGVAEFEAEIPKFFGDLRIMAVAWNGSSFGGAEKSMKVFDPIVISTSVPRFLSPGDRLNLQVNIINTTKNIANTTNSVSVSGPLSISGASTSTSSIAADRESHTAFDILSANTTGQAKITVTVKALNEVFTDVTEITVRPASSLQVRSGGGLLQAGSNVNLNFKQNFIPELADAKLLVSRSPMIRFRKHFKYLLGYPHGCAEQTISKAFPQLYFEEIVKSVGKETGVKLKQGENDFNPTYNVNAAISKLQSMQQYDGGLSYWPGEYGSDRWISPYALHFITEAGKKGFVINNKFKTELIEYCTELSNNLNEEYDYGYDESGNSYRKTILSRTKVYALYALAVAGTPNYAGMNYCKQNNHLLSNDSRYLLACAYYLTGDAGSYRQLLPAAFQANNALTGTDYSYSTGIRNMALSLNAMIEVNPTDKQIPVLARQLAELLDVNEYASTQEIAFSFLALGKLAQKAAQGNVSAVITADGQEVGRFSGKELSLSKNLFGKTVSISASGTGALYYFWESSGIDKTGAYLKEDNVLSARKQFYNRNGQTVNLANVKQNDLIIVALTVNSSYGSSIPRVAVTDILPACFEIENPRLTETRSFDWIGTSSYPEYFDIRDDRISYFGTVYGNQTYYYMVRAVSKGTYNMGPVSADAMNHPVFHSYNGGGSVTVN